MPMPPAAGEAESNPIMIAVMDTKPITAIVVLVRMGMAATPPATIFMLAASLSSTRATTAQTMIANFIPISTANPLKIIIITWLNVFN